MAQRPSSSQNLTRFNRRQTEGSNLPAQLDRAAEEFRKSLERHVRAILDAAEARAAEVEREADRYATKTQHESDARAQQMLENTFTRASRVLDSIELVESALSGMLGALRGELAGMAPRTLKDKEAVPAMGSPVEELPAAEEGRAPAQRLTGRLATTGQADEARRPAEQAETGGEQRPSPEERPAAEEARASAEPPTGTPVTTGQADEARGPVDEARRPADEARRSGEQAETGGIQRAPAAEPQADERRIATAPPADTSSRPQERRDDESTKPGLPNQESQAPYRLDITDKLDQMIRAQVRQMVQDGKPRADVERFLTRFRFGENYLGILDQLYAERSRNYGPPRRGLLRRMRRRAR